MKNKVSNRRIKKLKDGAHLGPSLNEEIKGLSSDEVNERIIRGDVNGEEYTKTKTVSEIIRTNLFTLFHLMNLLLALAILIFGELKNMLFMGVVIANAGIGIFQELRAKRLIDKLSLITAPKAVVVRDGERQEIKISNIVRDDIIILSSGSQIGADCEIVSGMVLVDESLLTGEPDHVKKENGDKLFAGSFVVAGECYAKVISVGEENYASQITRSVKKLKRPKSEILIGVNKIIKTVGVAIIPIGTLLFIKQFVISGIDISDAVTKTVAALIGMIPEGLVLLTSVVLAVSIIRLSSKKALVQELYCIEMLARSNIICLDKTGTLTEGKMQVDEFVPYENTSREMLVDAVATLAYGLNDNNQTAKALRDATICPEKMEVNTIVPFSSSRKWSAINIEGASFIMGAAEYIFKNDKKLLDEICKFSDEYYSNGKRVLVIAKSKEEILDDSEFNSLQLLGFTIISDVIRKGAPETISYFVKEGVAIKIISGDNPLTVSMIAKRCGVPDSELYIDVSTISSDEELKAIANNYVVFGRVSPKQKSVIVRALKETGNTVAMTGDGVNDIMALKESDCSIAPASGSDAARNVSNIVLLDSNFSSMPKIVAEGRRSINNLQRSSSLFLTKTIFSTVLALVFIFISQGYPLEPIQLTLISALTIGAPSFVLGLQQNHDIVKGHFLSNVLVNALPGAITDIVLVILISAQYGKTLSPVEVSTITVLIVGFIGFLVLFRVCLPFDLLRTALFITMAAAFLLAVNIFPKLFSLEIISLDLLEKLILPMIIAIVIFVFMSFIVSIIKKKMRKEGAQNGSV